MARRAPTKQISFLRPLRSLRSINSSSYDRGRDESRPYMTYVSFVVKLLFPIFVSFVVKKNHAFATVAAKRSSASQQALM